MTVGGTGSSNWTIENNFIIDNINNGINFSVSESEIKDNFLRGNGGGLSVGARNRTGTGDVTVSDIVIKGNEVSFDLEGSGIGVGTRVDAGGTARITDIRVQDNYLHDNQEGGILLQARGLGATVDYTRVEDNTVSGNELDGISLVARDGGIVTENQALENQVDSNSENGITLFARNSGSSVDNNKAEENQTHRNVGFGIQLHARDSGVVEENKLEDNTANNNEEGIVLSVNGGRVTENEVDGNSAAGNADEGFTATVGTEDNLFTENRSNANTGSSYFDQGTGNTFEDNQYNFNGAADSFPAGLCSP